MLRALGDCRPKCHRDLVEATGLSGNAVWSALKRCWRKGLILRSERPFREPYRAFKGRAGVRTNLRSYHLYVKAQKGKGTLLIDGIRFVTFNEGSNVEGPGVSKAKLILDFLANHGDRAFFSTEVAEALKDKGIKPSDIMSNVRRFERKGLVYVRGYRSHDRQTPFKEGYLLTWIDQDKPREKAIGEAVERTDEALAGRASTNPIIERVHRIRDMVIAASKTRDLLSFTYIKEELRCSEYEAEQAAMRALQLYPDLREVKVFSVYRYYYHESMAEEDLRAAVALKEGYIRVEKGRDNRVGHNWEGAVEWFIDKYTVGAVFREQPHRTPGMDPRRITLRLLRPVGGRRDSAEVDRVWTVTPGLFSPPTTYVLECKHGLIHGRDIDDFLEVLRWSKEFGVDTPVGRMVKQGVVGVFAGTAFDSKEAVKLRDGSQIGLASYAARLNVHLLKASDFNSKLRERGCPSSVTVQRICRLARDEREVREALDAIWRSPDKAEEILAKIAARNLQLYEFERMLEKGSRKG
ncbi:MAG: hypothetical protein ACP5QI_02115 [Candidatus Bathyarchaeia archaeon]